MAKLATSKGKTFLPKGAALGASAGPAKAAAPENQPAATAASDRAGSQSTRPNTDDEMEQELGDGVEDQAPAGDDDDEGDEGDHAGDDDDVVDYDDLEDEGEGEGDIGGERPGGGSADDGDVVSPGHLVVNEASAPARRTKGKARGLGKGKPLPPTGRNQPPRRTPIKLSTRCGLHIPPAMVKKRLKQNQCARNVSLSAAVFLAGAIEAILGEVLECGIACARESKRTAVTAQFVCSGIKHDEELSIIFKDVIIARGGNPQIRYGTSLLNGEGSQPAQ